MVSTEMLAILAARRGMMPCQPRKGGLMPKNSIGLNIIQMATTLVTYPTTALTMGIDRYSSG